MFLIVFITTRLIPIGAVYCMKHIVLKYLIISHHLHSTLCVLQIPLLDAVLIPIGFYRNWNQLKTVAKSASWLKISA